MSRTGIFALLTLAAALTACAPPTPEQQAAERKRELAPMADAKGEEAPPPPVYDAQGNELDDEAADAVREFQNQQEAADAEAEADGEPAETT